MFSKFISSTSESDVTNAGSFSDILSTSINDMALPSLRGLNNPENLNLIFLSEISGKNSNISYVPPLFIDNRLSLFLLSKLNKLY